MAKVKVFIPYGAVGLNCTEEAGIHKKIARVYSQQHVSLLDLPVY